MVALLAYLYTPFNIKTPQFLTSNVTNISGEVFTSAEVIVADPVEDWSLIAKRMRLTNLLLRYQKELSWLESQNSVPSPEQAEKIQNLRNKIENLQKMITNLAR